MEITQYIVLYFITPIAIFHTQIFHTPPLASISRLLSSNAFWSIDSSPWRLSCSCQGIQTHGCLLAIKASGKIPILSHHTIFIAQQPHRSIKASLYFFPTYDTAIRANGTNQKILHSKTGKSRASLWTQRAALLCYSVLA